MSKACINAGHAPNGMPDPGAVGKNGLRECDVALAVAKLVERYLTAAGVECLTVQDDNLGTICYTSNRFEADVFISIHCNSAENRSAQGFEVFTSRGYTYADELATCVSRQIETTFPDLYNRGLKEAGFYVLRNTNAPAILIELAFISNAFEEEFLGNEFNQDTYAKAIARGVTDYMQMLSE